MSDVKRCAACRKEKPVSEMKVCMHAEMHNYVCDSKCMHDFYNPPKAEKTGHAAIIAELQSLLSAAEAERNQLRAELAAIRGQQAVATLLPGDPCDERPGFYLSLEDKQRLADLPACTKLYALPLQQPDAVSVPRELLEWAVERWHAEVSQRPLGNVHRRTLDDTWRQIITKLGGDHGLLCGPRHDAIISTRQAEEGE